ncbi:hypothetical protein FRC12_009730 [Ceratobasidium sp. 428]|nr:hypothetical protein FRC12_009730 [Ceratobasidium sp. 428]
MNTMFSRPFTYLPARSNAGRKEAHVKARTAPLEEHFVTINLNEANEGLVARPEPASKREPFGEWVKHCGCTHWDYVN